MQNADSIPRKSRHTDSTGRDKKGIATEIQEVFTVRMGPSYLARIDAAARDRNLTRSQLIKKAIWAYLGANQSNN